MGIVSHCPNGHRIKVKDHLAGKKGICPSCGARFRIPLASEATPTTRPSPAAPAPPLPAAAGLPVAPVVSLDPLRAASLPPALMLSESAPPPAAIAEAPDASWCLAVPGGQPSEPMSSADLLRRLTATSLTGRELVWRSDWSDWRAVSTVFPDLLPDDFSPGTRAW